MTLPRTYVDGFLVEWEAGEYEAQVKSMRQRSKAIVPVLPGGVAGSSAGPASTAATAKRAQAVRARLARTTRRVPEVMVKIYSACRGAKHIGRHIDYISRKGLIDLEDQDGLILRGPDQLKALKEDWRAGGLEAIPDESERRDTLNIVFSMPADTDEVSMKRAVRAFASKTFADHQYVFAYHTRETDPDPDPPAHPHVHLSVKTLGWTGHRLGPKKADLQHWREDFADQLRQHGIEANATSRLARLNKDRGAKREVLGVSARGEPLRSIGRAPVDDGRVQRGQRLQATRVAYYDKVTEVLAQSEDPKDRGLAQMLRAFVAEFRPKAPRSQIKDREPER
jgi:hypothetical protein